MTNRRSRVALFIDRMTDGGVQRSFLALAEAFGERGFDVDIVIGDGLGLHRQKIPKGVRLITLTCGSAMSRITAEAKGYWAGWNNNDWRFAGRLRQRWRSFLPGLTAYLETSRPDALLSAKSLCNIVALIAKKRAGVSTRVVVSERTHLSASIGRSRRNWKASTLPRLIHDLYPDAAGIIAISNDVAIDLSTSCNLPRDRITTIHNGLLHPEALDLPASDHRWFDQDWPVILGVGRFSKEKDFGTLIEAFAVLRQKRPAKLILVGEGRERAVLEALIADLGIDHDVDLPGFSDNPYAYMKAASLFVMSSTHEGFGNVLIEALAAGCPAISTNCPGGPPEILAHGRIGPLVPVGDPKAMAAAMEGMLDKPPKASVLKARAAEFSMDRVAENYLSCLLPDWRGELANAAA